MDRVKRRAYIIGTLAVVLALNIAQNAGALGRIVNQAQSFQRYYHDLQQGQGSLSPIERLVFSLVLANSKSPEQTATGEIPVGRT